MQIDLPEVSMGVGKVLSEQKVEKVFQADVKILIPAMEARRSTTAAAKEFITLFDGVTLITNPALQAKINGDVGRGREMAWSMAPEGDHYERRELGSSSDDSDARPQSPT